MSTKTQEARKDAAKAAISQIKERYGEGSIMRLGEVKALNVDAISTGCLSIDIALGVGGVPRGRVIEIYGPESSGKTTLAQHIVAEAQKLGGVAAFVDAEHALDPEYAAKIGVDIDELFISQPDNGEQALEIVETLVRSSAVDVNRHRLKIEYDGRLHQPNSTQNWCYVWQPRNHPRGKRSEVLRLCAHRDPPRRTDQARGSDCGQPREGEGGEE
ncbi:MAG: Protein RecA [Parcubacteria group bacterium GW2011_GWA2_56_7]|nr:MAG: Protein RecA [Parcubacteria group bacterium GW2011_GWA2_56_7]